MSYLFHLSGYASSGRGVKVRQLNPTEVDAAGVEAARSVGKDCLNVEYNQAKAKELVERMLVAVTKATGLKSMDEVKALPASEWVPLTQAKLNDPEGEYRFNKIFTARDDGLLCGITSRLHIARVDEVEAIMGKALMVSED